MILLCLISSPHPKYLLQIYNFYFEIVLEKQKKLLLINKSAAFLDLRQEAQHFIY